MHVSHCLYRLDQGWSQPLPVTMDGPQTLVLVFAAPRFDAEPSPIDELARAFPSACLVGCSSSGEMAGRDVVDDSLSVAIARFERTRLRQASTRLEGSEDSSSAGTRLGAQLAAADLRAVFVLSCGLGVNGSALVEGLTRQLGPDVCVSGGLAGDGSAFGRTWVLDRDGRDDHRVSAVGFYGDSLRVSHGCSGGWQDFGPERRITRAEGPELFELDGKPALDLYKTYLGVLAEGLPGAALRFPLAVRRDDSTHAPVVRTILAIDEQRRSLTFAGDIPQQGVARLMRANTEQLIDSASHAAQQARPAAPEAASLVISVSCVGRRLVLGERTDQEIEAVVDGMPDGAVHMGYYSYGEISPTLAGRCSELHNQTMTVTVFGED